MVSVWNPGYTKFTYFWRRSVFSQWLPSKFVIDGITYTHAEQWMMAEKARLFNDTRALSLILESDDPKTQKRLGREVQGFNEGAWNDVARQKVYVGNYHKFNSNPAMLEALRATSDTLLVEASPYDKIWGIGVDPDDAEKGKPWQGTNWLGEVLTKLRENWFQGCRHYEE